MPDDRATGEVIRAEMLTQILVAQSDLTTALAQLSPTADSALRAQISAQLLSLAGLERAVATGNPAALAAVRNEITAAVAASAGASQQARDNAQHIDVAELAAASTTSRRQVQSLMRDMHHFDPYLRFASPDDETEYRRREAERRDYIEQQHARGTPEGNLNAAGAAVGQMADAGAHGADRSPRYNESLNTALGAYNDLRASMINAGRSTAAADAQLTNDVRRTLRGAGLSDAQIDARLAVSPNPADALRPAQVVSQPESATATSLDEVAAALRAAGVVPPSAETLPGHGLTANRQPVMQQGGRG